MRERIQKLLIQWGFENEVNAACFCNAVAGSKVFKSGYEWARKQSEDYLMLHYGIYYDEWNSIGLKRIPDAQMEKVSNTSRQETSSSKFCQAGRKKLTGRCFFR